MLHRHAGDFVSPNKSRSMGGDAGDAKIKEARKKVELVLVRDDGFLVVVVSNSFFVEFSPRNLGKMKPS